MLVDGDGVVKLSDFGTSVHLSEVQEGEQRTQPVMAGTIPYLAPECLCEGKYCESSDVWALACSVAEMGSGVVPWSDKLTPEQRAPVTMAFAIGTAQPPNHHPTIPDHFSAALRDILSQCFAADGSKRPTAEQLLEDSYFAAPPGCPSDAEPMKEYQMATKERSLSGSRANSDGSGSGCLLACNTSERMSMLQTYGATMSIPLVAAA